LIFNRTLTAEYETLLILPSVILDTCVLAPMPLCDTLLRLAESPALYVPKWSADILRELRSTLLKMGYTEAQATRRITAMDMAFEDACVRGYDHVINVMTNHPKDRHVLAAAVHVRASVIVTHNIRDFPPKSLKLHSVAVLTPDAFLQGHVGNNQDLVRHRLTQQAAACQMSLHQLLARLHRDLPGFASMMGM
jgi:predicted nucleic acid-binding protein